ncbi:hypothetical protein VAR608DRAFT_6388 [Variovorax sp. HW608]|uniref:hypothetical protein n=1 Tax=Variovorax sp. HW608 TaxID=1034889 RepID=UPI00081FA1B6|nr:hypothetical protein [Variovorax sp. HW608]SCK59228.1 hypothetical protein VAR608DRAFT_6388 [Variovorax sp. HW608]
MILIKTETGHRVLKDRSVRLTPRQRSAFILFDGRRSVNEVIESGMGIVPEDIDQLVELGLLEPIVSELPASSPARPDAPASHPTPVAATQPPSGRSSQQRYKDAYPIATQLTASLGLRGFRLNLAVEGTSTFEQLHELLPKIQSAVGPDKAAALERALVGD